MEILFIVIWILFGNCGLEFGAQNIHHLKYDGVEIQTLRKFKTFAKQR